MAFGDQKTNVSHYYYEQYLQADYNSTIAQGATLRTTILGNALPWNADVVIEGHANYSFSPTVCAVELWSNLSSPAPNSYYAGKICEYDDNGGWCVCTVFTRWTNISAGSTPTLNLDHKCTVANGTVALRSFVGLLRARMVGA
jgi:hypothetical protein